MGMGEMMGQIVGGFTTALGGVVKILMTIVTSMAGFKTLVELVKSVLVEGLQPLNKAFKEITKALKPALKVIKDILKIVADSVVEIITSLLPIIEAIKPILEVIMDVLKPILSMLTGLIKAIIAPLASVLMTILVPVVQEIGSALKIVEGVLQVGLGTVITALGAILTAVGFIAKVVTLGMYDDAYDKGKEMLSTGTQMIADGTKNIWDGTTELITNITDAVGITDVRKDDEETKPKSHGTVQKPVNTHGSVMDGITGYGDVLTNSNNTTTNIYNTYGGSGGQSSYGSYMNMGKRGCGPIALADAVNRRTGSKTDPRSMAAYMNRIGTYDGTRGTSIGGFVNTGNAMGVGMRVGGVTSASLKHASPRNPITVIGSGSSYGTHDGSNHYMNVVGSDKHGGVYVANPLTGKVGRQSMMSVVNHSVAGIYGSGDDDYGFNFSDETKDAFKELQEYTNKILGMFDFDNAEASLESDMEAENTKNKNKLNKSKLGEEEYNKQVDAARKQFEKDFPRKPGETEVAYEKRWEKNKDAYIAKTAGSVVSKNYKDSAEKTTGAMQSVGEAWFGKYDPATGTYDGNGYAKSLQETINKANTAYANQQTSSGSGSSGAGGFISDRGVTLGSPSIFKPKYKDIDLTDNNAPNGSGHSPVHDFFTQMATDGSMVYSSTENWFRQRNNPDKTGTGTSGGTHGGIDFLWTNGSQGQPLYATTGGTIVRADFMDSTGNQVMWQDSAGMYHWYMHLHEHAPGIHNGVKINPGQILGYAGNTGQSSGAHLHYTITDDMNARSSDLTHSVNPLTYFGNFNGGINQSAVQITDKMKRVVIGDQHMNQNLHHQNMMMRQRRLA